MFKPFSSQEKGELARLSSFVGAIAISDLVKTTLGPKGMDKILQSANPRDSETISITNDGATILKSVQVDNPAAKILIDISKIQDQEVGDGTTTVAILAGELLREAEKLINQKIHPQIIIEGYRQARDIAKAKLNSISFDHNNDSDLLNRILLNIAKTTLSSKLVYHDKEHFAKIALDAILRIKYNQNLEYIKIIKKPGGSMKDSYLDEGYILEKSISVGCPKRLENPKIMVANTPMDYDKIKIFGSKVKVDTMDKVAEIEQAEKNKMKDKVEKILAYKPNIFINRQLIYNYPEQLMADKGVMVIEHADFEGTERLAAVLGADIMSTFDTPDISKLGYCKLVSEIMIGEDKVIKFSGCSRNEACTIVLRGAGIHILDEMERTMHDALCVLLQTLKNNRVIFGGGNSEMQMAIAIEQAASKIETKEAYAMKAYATALRSVISAIADNGGYDSQSLLQKLNSEINMQYKPNCGINMIQGKISSMEEMGIFESMRVKEHALILASEAAEQILRVDQIVRCEPRKREDPRQRFMGD